MAEPTERPRWQAVAGGGWEALSIHNDVPVPAAIGGAALAHVRRGQAVEERREFYSAAKQWSKYRKICRG